MSVGGANLLEVESQIGIPNSFRFSHRCRAQQSTLSRRLAEGTTGIGVAFD
jgi:hypothetical protein